MTRDFHQYPENDSGEVLWRLKCDGDDHSIPRDIDFFLEFETEDAAMRCGIYLFKNCYKVELDPPLEDETDSSWTVKAIPYMRAEYADISGMERDLTEIAEHFQGKLSGWGCEAQSVL